MGTRTRHLQGCPHYPVGLSWLPSLWFPGSCGHLVHFSIKVIFKPLSVDWGDRQNSISSNWVQMRICGSWFCWCQLHFTGKGRCAGVCVISGWFRSPRAELSSCHRYQNSGKNLNNAKPGPFQKRLDPICRRSHSGPKGPQWYLKKADWN